MKLLDKFHTKLDIEGNIIFYRREKIARIQEPNILQILNWSEYNEDDIRIDLIDFLKDYSIRTVLFLDITVPNNYLISYYLNRGIKGSNISEFLDWNIFYDIILDTLNYYGVDIEFIKSNREIADEICRILVVENRNKIIDSL